MWGTELRLPHPLHLNASRVANAQSPRYLAMTRRNVGAPESARHALVPGRQRSLSRPIIITTGHLLSPRWCVAPLQRFRSRKEPKSIGITIAGRFQTATGTVTGSPAYTAPEMLSGVSPSAVSDIYGLGATLFCAITGRAAFERRSGEHVVAQFLRITTQQAPDFRGEGILEDISAVIERAMSAEPHDRPATAAEFDERLRKIQLDNGFPLDHMALPANLYREQRNPSPSVPRLPTRD